MALIEVGAVAPDFTLADQDKKKHTLSDYQGNPVVLLFYPLDFSGICSEEMTCVMDNMARFKELNAQVFGISVDSTYCHQAFANERGVEYPLLADFHPKGEVCKAYGLWLDGPGIGDRATVLIGKDGKVLWAESVSPGVITSLENARSASSREISPASE